MPSTTAAMSATVRLPHCTCLYLFDTTCLETADGGTADGTTVQIYDYTGAATQQRRVQSGGELVNVGSPNAPCPGSCVTCAGTPLRRTLRRIHHDHLRPHLLPQADETPK